MPTPDLGQQIADLRAVVERANPPDVMTTEECAVFLNVTTETLFSWRKRGEGPRFSKPTERMVRYLRTDVVAWLEENRA
jgi:hypothetical protein